MSVEAPVTKCDATKSGAVEADSNSNSAMETTTTTTTGSNSNSNLNANSPSKQFAFRPSKLSAITEQIWKKDTNSNQKSSASLNLIAKPNISSSQEASTSSSTGTTNTTSTSSANFIFGQNIKERVVIKSDGKKVEDGSKNEENEMKELDHVKKFEDFKDIKNESTAESEARSNHAATLEESAKQYEEQINSAKLKLSDHVDIKTGEENEISVISISCKLHVFDGEKHNWEERGAAIFKINETDEYITGSMNDSTSTDEESSEKCQNKSKTRIVARLQGSLRVVINTKLWTDMLIERVSPKRLKLSAIDFLDKSVVLYLITANQHEIDKIEDVLNTKLKDLKNVEEKSPGPKRKSDVNHRMTPEKKPKID